MITGLDKAITALIMAALTLLSMFNLLPFTVTDQTATTIGAVIAALTPVLVYLIPNKSKP